MKVLHLTLHRQWFDQIALGIKTVEFREIKPYWHRRLCLSRFGDLAGMVPRQFDEIHFRNGYSDSRPWMRAAWGGLDLLKNVRTGTQVFGIRLGPVLETRNWDRLAAEREEAFRQSCAAHRQIIAPYRPTAFAFTSTSTPADPRG